VKRFEFRLEQVLRLRQQRHKAAELRQREAQTAHDSASAEVAKVRERIERASLEGAARFGPATSVVTWVSQSTYLTMLEQNLRAAEANARAAEQSLQAAVAARAAAAKEEETLVALRDRQWQEYKREAARHEQHWLDELGMRRWQAVRRAMEQDAENQGGPSE
jgi:flagellar export protein FliJ